MKIFLLSFILFSAILSSAQKINFSITINFKLIVPTKHIRIQTNDIKQTFISDYPPNDILFCKGIIDKPGLFQIFTDSTSSRIFWVDNIPITLAVVEERTKFGNTILDIKQVEGSDDSKLLFEMTHPKNMPQPNLSPTQSNTERDSIFKSFYAKYFYSHIDSIFTFNPTSPILPFYLNTWENFLSLEAVESFYNRLSPESQKSEEGKSVKEFLDRSVLLKKGNVIENFSMKKADGKKFSLYSVHAKYILLDFWASWCGPCRIENPDLLEAYNKFKQKGFEVISISLDDEMNDWLKAIKKDNLTWQQISELNGWENSIAKKYKISFIPYGVLLDNQYKVVANYIDSNNLELLLDQLLK